jgi:hypothetical protein
MDLPRVKKQLWDLLPKPGALGAGKHLSAGLLAVAIGALGANGQPPASASSPAIFPAKQESEIRGSGFVLSQPTTSPQQLYARHWSHSSHSSHSSHHSHYSSR